MSYVLSYVSHVTGQAVSLRRAKLIIGRAKKAESRQCETLTI
nr:MAG TPA: hypothetical protein [Caudoviricetes sp.]DAQ65318.1 MAG TPA: hypothetical protein [Caudoviricetes sp.]